MLARLLAWALVTLACAGCGEGASSSGAGQLPADGTDVTVVWERELHGARTSSPRAMDVNADGVLDVILGAGTEPKFGLVVALDGRTGEELWRQDTKDEVYASACLIPINADDVPDVVIGRRRHYGGLNAYDGRTGQKLWGIRPANKGFAFPNMHYNTVTPCPDLDGDGRRDLICLQGGGDDEARTTGRLYLVSSASGKILRDFPMPDGRESYLVPALERVTLDRGPGASEGWRLIIGTGGETVPGNLYSLDFPSLEEQWRVGSDQKGWVAGAMLHDFEGTGSRDVVAASFDGVILRIDGETGEIIWSVEHPGFEVYPTPTLGRFDSSDDVLDVVAVLSEGAWPNYEKGAVVEWLDGRTGQVLDRRDVGAQGMGSPVIVDLDGDGLDETVQIMNLTFSFAFKDVVSRLVIFDGRPGKPALLSRDLAGFSASTPWIGDMENDGRLDLVVVYTHHVARLSLSHADQPSIRWNQYRGSSQRSVVR